MWLLSIFCLAVVSPVLDGDIDSRIVGGKETIIEKHPYQVSVRNVVQKAFCGGFIVSNNYVLTAAHCVLEVVSPFNNKVQVTGGSTSRTGGTDIPVAEVKSHPKYGSNRIAPLDNDIAIITTRNPIVFSNRMRAIAVTPLNRTVSGTVIVTGWGKTSDVSKLPDTLRVVELPVVEMAECKKLIGPQFTDNMLCAGDLKKGKISSCGGDSGGPAVQDSMVVGIVSFGAKCGDPHVPSVYTNLAASSIRKFINENTKL